VFEGMKRKMLFSSISGVAQVIVNIGLLIVTIPLFITKLGLQTYGIYALITAIGSLGVFTNFGFTTSLIKYLAEQGNQQESDYDIVVVLIIIGVSTSLVAFIAFVFEGFILRNIMNIASEVITRAVLWFYIACIGANIFQVLSQIPSAILDAQQKVYITNTIQLCVGVITKCAIIISLFIAPNLASIGWILLLSSIMGFTSLGWFAFKSWGRLSCPAIGRWFVPITKKHFAYGRSIYATSLMTFFYEPFIKVLLSHYIGLAEVGFFDIALRIRSVVSSVLDRLLYPVLPMLAQISSLEKIRDVITELQHKILLLLIPILVFMIFIAEPMITLWIGINVKVIAISVMAVVSCNLISEIYQPVYFFLMVKGYPVKTFILQSVNVIVNLVIFYIAVPSIGYYGALCAYCIAFLTSIALCARYQWLFLNSKSITSKDFGLKIFMHMICLVIVNIILTYTIQGEWLRINLLIITNGLATIVLYRLLKMITINDIDRYVGINNRFGLLLGKLFVQRV
jgi:O-antigen/teichoic acid export membrane protein